MENLTDLCKIAYGHGTDEVGYIKLYDGSFAIVDKEDFDWLDKWKWHRSPNGYVQRSDPENRNGKIRMHRQLVGVPGLVVDHINGNKLDNRRENLRVCTQQKNCLNRSGLNKNNTSGYCGVIWRKDRNKWQARIMEFGKTKYLGCYKEKSLAIEARKEAEEWATM